MKEMQMEITWTKSEEKYEYYYGTTNSKFSAQIGCSTEPGEYVWMIFHADSNVCQYGDSETSIEKAKQAVCKWLLDNEDWSVQT